MAQPIPPEHVHDFQPLNWVSFVVLQNLSSNESHVFDITISNKKWASSRDVFNATNNFLYVPVELSLFNSTDSLESINVSLVQSPGSTLGPIVNAAELYAATAPPPPSTLASDGKRYILHVSLNIETSQLNPKTQIPNPKR